MLILTIAAAGVLVGAGTASADWGSHHYWGHHYYYQPNCHPYNPYCCPAPAYPHGYAPYHNGYYHRWTPYHGFREFGHFGGRWMHRR